MVDRQRKIERAAAAQAGGEAGGGGGAGTVGISQVHGPPRRAGAGAEAESRAKNVGALARAGGRIAGIIPRYNGGVIAHERDAVRHAHVNSEAEADYGVLVQEQ